MADKARKLTDKELNKLEREIYELYATASDEISKSWRKYMESHKKTIDNAFNELQEAKKLGDKNIIAEAQEKYERTVRNVTLNDARYRAMINETTAKLANVNQTALDYVNGDMPKIYTLNYNAFGDEKIDGYTFTLVNERAIASLALSNQIQLPKKKINIPKDEAWNAKHINSQLMQGILQGESVSKIAKRLQNVTNMNRNSAIRNARTMVTGAENKGRQDSFTKAQSDGVIMKRRWISTHDERTRAWHSDLDGKEVAIDEPWENDYGKIMYPGDPTAHAANVYNCRCSIRAVVKGFAWSQQQTTTEETNSYKVFDDKANIKTETVGRFVWEGEVIKEGHEVKYATEYLGGGKDVVEFFDNNSNYKELINNMNDNEKKLFKDMWTKGKFMQGQQYKGFSNMKPKEQTATRTFDKFLDQSTLDSGIEVKRLSDAQLVLGAGNGEGTLESLLAMQGKKITCGANMSFSAASEGLRIMYTGQAPTVEYSLKISGGSKGSGMFIGDDSVNIWGNKQREFMTNRDIWMTVGKTEYDEIRNIYKVELEYGGLMEHDYK